MTYSGTHLTLLVLDYYVKITADILHVEISKFPGIWDSFFSCFIIGKMGDHCM